MTLILLSLYNLILTGSIAAFSLLRAESVHDLPNALSFTPAILFFGLNTYAGISSVRKKSGLMDENRLVSTRPKKISKPKVDTISDANKRDFLKILGATGLSFFLFSIFNRRPETPFFGGSTGSGTTALIDSEGNKVEPAEKTPTDGYKISEIDDSLIAFYGFTDKDGAWFIMREDSETGSIRYSKGA